MNQIQLIGNLGRDPEMSYTPSGAANTKFSIAVTSGYGEYKITQWFNVTSWNKLAETANDFLHKGNKVFVQGELKLRTYQNRDGKPGYSLDVNASMLQFLTPKQEDKPMYNTAEGLSAEQLGDLDDHPF